MLLKRAHRAALYSTALVILALVSAHPTPPAEAAAHGGLEGAPLDAFLAAPSREAAAQLVDSLIKGGIGFDDAYRALQRGRRYGPAATGVVRLGTNNADG